MFLSIFPLRRRPVALVLALFPLLAVGCHPPRAPETDPAAVAETGARGVEKERELVILSINDVYRIEGVDEGTAGGLPRVRALRRELEKEHPDLLFLHAGDLLFPSLLSRQLLGEQMIDVLNQLDGAPGQDDSRFVAVFGNHEFEKAGLEDAGMLQTRVEESEFLWLDTNLRWAEGDDGKPLVDSPRLRDTVLLESGGVRVGLYGLVTDLENPEYVVDFGDLEAVARRSIRELRSRGAEVVVALTHLPMGEDLKVLRALGSDGPDLVIGGHEHNRLCGALDASGAEIRCEEGESLPPRPVIKADAEARTAAVVRVRPRAEGGAPEIALEFRHLDTETPEDPALRAVVDDWLQRHEAQYCFDKMQRPPGCLSEVLGHTRVRLQGEELRIRRFESNLGNFIVDQALEGYRDGGAVAAFINSGSIRLNQDIPSGADITLRHLEEIFQFSSDLRLLKIRGEVLQQVLEHSITDWTGNGRFLQLAGIAFRHDPDRETADRLTLLTPDGPRLVDPEEELLVVTSDYLATPATGQDGYTMLTADMVIADAESKTLRELTVDALREAGTSGIAPEVEGRICTEGYIGPCLAVAE